MQLDMAMIPDFVHNNLGFMVNMKIGKGFEGMEPNQKSGTRWLLVLFFTLFMAVMTYNLIVFPAFAVDTMKTYGVGQTALTTLASVTSVVGVFTGLLFGRLLDTKGPRKVIMTFMAIGIVLFFGRAFVTAYPIIVVLTFLASACVGVCQIAAPKVLDTWFPKEEVGPAVSFQAAGAGIGSAGGFALGAVITLHQALLSIGALYVILWLLWIAVGKEGPYKVTASKAANVSAGGTKVVLKSSYLWLLIIALSLGVTSTLLINTYMVNAFIAKGLAPTGASMMATVLNLSLLASGFIASFAVAKIQRYNPLIIFTLIVGAGLELIAWFTPLGTSTWILMAAGGLILGGNLGLSTGRIPLIAMTGQFSAELIGTAAGTVEMIKGIISFVLPIFVAIIFGKNFNAIFITFFIFCIIATIAGALLIPELGQKGKVFKEFQAVTAQKNNKQYIMN